MMTTVLLQPFGTRFLQTSTGPSSPCGIPLQVFVDAAGSLGELFPEGSHRAGRFHRQRRELELLRVSHRIVVMLLNLG